MITLTEEEKRSRLWKKLMDHWAEQLASWRTQNDGDKSETTTANIRGRIAQIKSDMLLDKDLTETNK